MSWRLFWIMLLAYFLWFIVLKVEVGNFWIRVSVSAVTLSLISLNERKDTLRLRKANLRLISLGIVTGSLSYVVLFLGFSTAKSLVSEGATSVYILRAGMPLTIIAILLVVVSVGEELFWRGLIQHRLEVIGKFKSLLVASTFYSTIHVWSLNLPLMMIALVMGLCWGAIFMYTHSLQATIVSHIVWDELVFVFLPLIS